MLQKVGKRNPKRLPWWREIAGRTLEVANRMGRGV